MTNSEQQIAIISGASSGIGQAIANKLVSNDYKLGLNGRSQDRLNQALNKINLDSVVLKKVIFLITRWQRIL